MIQRGEAMAGAVIQAGRDPLTGRWRQLSGSAVTEREAVRLERQLRGPRSADRGPPGWVRSPRPLGGPHDRVSLLRPWPTIASNLDSHILPMLGGKKVAEIRPRVVAMFLSHLMGIDHLDG